MKKNYLLIGILSFSLALVSFNAFSQKKIYGENGTPTFIQFNDGSSQQKSSLQPLASSAEVLRSYLPISPIGEFKVEKSTVDKIGFSHLKHQQYYKGIKVEFGTFIAHGRNGQLEAANGHFVPMPESLNVVPTLSEKDAFQKALLHVNAKQYMWDIPEEEIDMPEAELVIIENLENNTKTPTLAYKLDIYAMEPFSRHNVYISAVDGQLVAKIPTIFEHKERGEVLERLSKNAKAKVHHDEKEMYAPGNADTRYSGSQIIEATTTTGGFRLWDDTRGAGVRTRNINNGSSTNFNNGTDFVDNDNNWTAAEWDNSDWDNAALDAHWASEVTYDYYSLIHGRDSYDGNGTVLLNLVHALTNWFNAQWTGTTMRYGDGNANPLTTLDVGAHEMTHGVTTTSSNLIYFGESGALNEAFSDIFAAAVENYSGDPNKQIWLVGEDIGYIRNMENPNDRGHPDTYQGDFWASTTGGDSGGVHTNSGVLNHWFYILSVGKTGTNDNGDSYSVSGLTIEKAEQIAFRMNTVYLTQSSNYAAARTAGIQSAIDIYGAGSDEEIQTTNAFYAVGVGDKFDDGLPDPCTSVISNFPYSESFESGLGEWSQGSGDDIDWTRDSGGTPSNGTGPTSASDGTWYMYTEASGNGNGYPGKTAYFNGPCFNLSSLSNPTFDFDYHMLGAAMGTMTLQVSTDDGVSWDDVWSVSENQGDDWQSASVSLAAFSGEIRMRYVGVTGNNFTSDMTIDNLVLDGADGPSCGVPGSLASSSVGQTSATISWGVVNGASSYEYRYRATGTNTWSTTSTSGTSATLSGLSSETEYEFQARALCTGATSAYSTSATFTTLGDAPVTYCTSQGGGTYEYIASVQIDAFQNTSSGTTPYTDYTSLTASVGTGSVSVSLTPGFTGNAYTEHWKIWIDLNQDGDFSDANEEVFSGSGNSTVSGNMTIPAGVSGTTRMRIAMKYNSAVTSPCGDFGDGETEDYTVSIGGAALSGFATTGELNLNDNNLYRLTPNPATATATLVVDDKALEVNILTMTGEVLSRIPIKRSGNTVTFDLTTLSNGMYLVNIKGGDKSVFKRLIKE